MVSQAHQMNFELPNMYNVHEQYYMPFDKIKVLFRKKEKKSI